MVTAGAGWGKTTLLTTTFPQEGTAWYRVDAADRRPADLLAGLHAALEPSAAVPEVDAAPEMDGAALEAAVQRLRVAWEHGPQRLVVEDVHHLRGEPSQGVLRMLTEPPAPDRQLVLTARQPPGVIDDRSRASGEVLEVDARDLALDLGVVAAAVEEELGRDKPLAARITDATGGWPAGVRLAIDALVDVEPSRRSAALERLIGPSGPIGRYLRRVVAADAEGRLQETLARIHLLDGTTPERLAALCDAPPEQVDEQVEGLLQRGLVRDRVGEPGVVEIAPAVQRLVDEHVLPRLEPETSIVEDLADTLVRRGETAAGLAVLARADRPEHAVRILEEQGRALIHGGHLAAVATSVERLPAELRTPRIESLRAEALAFRGEWARALRCLDAAGLEESGTLPTELATQLGLIHHTRGDLAAAIDAYRRGPAQEDRPAFGVLLGWRATAHWLRGELEDARACVDEALSLATRHGADRALAYAHTAAALVAASDGDRRGNINHYRLALAAAEHAGDALQQARILTNLGSHHLEEGRFDEALEVTGRAIDLAETQGFATVAGIARCNRSEALLQTGAVDESIADAERAREVFARIGARTEAYAHHVLGAARTERGELALARQAYEHALRLGSPSGDRQALVPAHVGLAWVLSGTDQEAARSAIERARELDDGMAGPEVAAAEAWVALADGDHERAAALAQTARQLAGARGNQGVVARALTCLALTERDPVPGLRDALTVWRDMGAPLWELRVQLAIARRSSRPAERADAPELERRLTALSCAPEHAVWATRVLLGTPDCNSVGVRALGTFAVAHAGIPLPAGAWGSRKARELVKVLVARAPRPVTREDLGHLLWPDEPYDRVSSRLSTALSLARTALAGEDGDRDDAPISTEGGAVRLDIERIEVDVLAFQQAADGGLRAVRAGEVRTATSLLLEAESLYGGDLFEDDPDLPWAEDRRAELRSLYLTVARTLARTVGLEDPELAIRLLLRVLDRDAYDEPAHLNLAAALLRAGRHGEARRRYNLYRDRMAELDLPAVPFHEVSHGLEDHRGRVAS